MRIFFPRKWRFEVLENWKVTTHKLAQPLFLLRWISGALVLLSLTHYPWDVYILKTACLVIRAGQGKARQNKWVSREGKRAGPRTPELSIQQFYKGRRRHSPPVEAKLCSNSFNFWILSRCLKIGRVACSVAWATVEHVSHQFWILSWPDNTKKLHFSYFFFRRHFGFIDLVRFRLLRELVLSLRSLQGCRGSEQTGNPLWPLGLLRPLHPNHAFA